MYWLRSLWSVVVGGLLLFCVALLQATAVDSDSAPQDEDIPQPEVVAVEYRLAEPPVPPELVEPAVENSAKLVRVSTRIVSAVVEPRVEGEFEYSAELAREGMELVRDRPVVIRADYGALGYARFVQALQGIGGRAFLVKQGSRPSFLAEVDPVTCEVLDEDVTAQDLGGLAVDLAREIAGDRAIRRRVQRAAAGIGEPGDVSLVLLLPRSIEAFCRAGLKRALNDSGWELEDFKTFLGRYVPAGARIELRLDRGIRSDGRPVETQIRLRLPASQTMRSS